MSKEMKERENRLTNNNFRDRPVSGLIIKNKTSFSCCCALLYDDDDDDDESFAINLNVKHAKSEWFQAYFPHIQEQEWYAIKTLWYVSR